MNDIKFIVLMNFLYFLLVLLKFEFRQILLFDLLFQNIWSDFGIILYSSCSLFLIFLSKPDFVWLLNEVHKVSVVLVELIFVLIKIFFDGFIGFFGDSEFESTDCDVDVFDDVFSVKVIN